jgi:pyruvate dehydrogenase E2 component (dihydrolipoamide acetyltransferase)
MSHEVKLTIDGLLINWLKDVGESVSASDIIAEFEADKATVEVEAGAEGTVLELRAESGDEVDEGTIIAVIGTAQEVSVANHDSTPKQAEAPVKEAPQSIPAPITKDSNGASMAADGRIKVSPIARRIAADKGIDLSQVSGTGPGGRIVKVDVENFIPSEAKPKVVSAPSVASAPVSQQTWGHVPEEDVEILEISRMRRAIADGTIKSKTNIPHFYVTIEVDVEPLLALRKEINTGLADEGIKISVNDMLIKALALALKKFPNLNTHYYGDKMVRHKRINIGVSVALPNNGLANVVAHDADKLALSELAVSNKEMYDRAREGKIKPEDVHGATFTISNLGPFNVLDFSAIISAPEAGIIAVSSARKVPIVLEDGSLGVGTRMNITVSIDHRVSDGAEGAQFMNILRDLIESPMRLLV